MLICLLTQKSATCLNTCERHAMVLQCLKAVALTGGLFEEISDGVRKDGWRYHDVLLFICSFGFQFHYLIHQKMHFYTLIIMLLLIRGVIMMMLMYIHLLCVPGWHIATWNTEKQYCTVRDGEGVINIG